MGHLFLGPFFCCWLLHILEQLVGAYVLLIRTHYPLLVCLRLTKLPLCLGNVMIQHPPVSKDFDLASV